jgi:hypothetical protein
MPDAAGNRPHESRACAFCRIISGVEIVEASLSMVPHWDSPRRYRWLIGGTCFLIWAMR